MEACRYVPGFVSTTARSSKRAKEFGFCPSFCPPKVPGSTPSSPSGCMPRRLLWNPMVCSRLSSWLNAFVLTLAAPMNPFFPLSKRLRDSALGAYKLFVGNQPNVGASAKRSGARITTSRTSPIYRPLRHLPYARTPTTISYALSLRKIGFTFGSIVSYRSGIQRVLSPV